MDVLPPGSTQIAAEQSIFLNDPLLQSNGPSHSTSSLPLHIQSSDQPMIPFPNTAQSFDPSSDWMATFLRSATVDHLYESFTEPIDPGPSCQPLADWGFTDIFNDDIFGPMGTHARGSPARDEDLVRGVEPEEIDGRLNVRELPDGQPVTSSWVSSRSTY
jgi:hypothetical protein